MFIKTMTPAYYQHLQFQSIESFKKLYDVGISMEDSLLEKGKSPMKNVLNSGKKQSTTLANKGAKVSTVTGPYRKRSFSNLGIPLSIALERLQKRRLLHPFPPQPELPPERWPPIGIPRHIVASMGIKGMIPRNAFDLGMLFKTL